MAMKDRDLAKALHLVGLRNISPESLAEKIAGCIKSARKKAVAAERERHRPLLEANHPAATCTCGIGEGGDYRHAGCPTAAGIAALRRDPEVPEDGDAREALRDILPYVRIDQHDDETGTYWCLADPPCREKVTLESPEAEQDRCYERGFPHAPDCPLAALLRRAKSLADGS